MRVSHYTAILTGSNSIQTHLEKNIQHSLH